MHLRLHEASMVFDAKIVYPGNSRVQQRKGKNNENQIFYNVVGGYGGLAGDQHAGAGVQDG